MPKKRSVLKAEAQERLEAREARSDEDQLKRLISKGHGNCAEAEALRIRLSMEVSSHD